MDDMEETKILHVITQDDQPMGSQRKCCERCGLAVWNCENYVTEKHLYTEEVAKEHNLTRCTDARRK